MTSRDECFVKAVEAIYDAAGAPNLWPTTLGQIAICVDAVGAVLQDQFEDGTFAMVASPGLQAATDAYRAGWWKQDIRAARAVERGLLKGRGYVTDFDIATPEEMRTHPFFAEFNPSHGLGFSLAVPVWLKGRVVISLGVQRAAGKPPFEQADIDMLQRLAEFVSKALRLSLQIFESEIIRDALGVMLSRVGAGAFLLDEESKIVFANAAAHRAMGRALQNVNQRLVPSDVAARARLDAEISAAIRGDPAKTAGQLPALTLRDSQRGKVLVLYVLGLENSSLGAILGSLKPTARAIVLVIDQNEAAPYDTGALSELFGLTPSEAKLAVQIATGVGPSAAAEKLGIKVGTVRTVLKKVFDKTGVTRQSELAAVLARVVLREG